MRREGPGIGYADEILSDRDRHGVLWQRVASQPGQGRPEFGNVHPGRQRRAMRDLLCQVCGGPADHTDLGTLWLLHDHDTYHHDWPGWPERMATAEPPICQPCAHTAIHACPALRKGHIAIRVGHPIISGIRGILYHPGPLLPTPIDEDILPYDDPRLPWACAVTIVRELFHCTIVHLDPDSTAP